MTTLRFTVILMLVATAAAAQTSSLDSASCCIQRTSFLDSLVNPTRGSDENFFTAGAGYPNVTFVLDTSCSMNAWPQDWPSSEGCNHSGFTGNGFDPTANYRGMIKGISSGQPVLNTDWFTDTKIYRADGNHLATAEGGQGEPFGTDLTSAPGGTKWNDKVTACADITTAGAYCDSGWTRNSSAFGYTYHSEIGKYCHDLHWHIAIPDAVKAAACVQCIDTKGYYVKDSNKRIASGKYLKFYSPKSVSALMVLSQLIYDVQDVRLSIITFDSWDSQPNKNCWDGSKVCIWQTPDESCNAAAGNNNSVSAARHNLLNKLNSDMPFTSSTPLATSLYAANYFLRGAPPSVSTDAFTTLFGAGNYPTANSGATSLTQPDSNANKSVCNGCSFNAVVVLTDGEPNNEIISGSDFPADINNRYDGGTSVYCPNSTNACKSKLDEVASYFWEMPAWNASTAPLKDLRPEYVGKQRVATYTIGFGTNSNANMLLNSTAKAGGGVYYPATSSAAITSALSSIFDDIVSRNNSFASASVASVQTGSTSTPAVLARVLPRSGETWRGRLWRFNQFNEFVENRDLNSDGDLADIFTVDSAADLPDGGRGETATNIVIEDSNGEFIRQATSAPAVPYWEANAALVDAGVLSRNVWTLLDVTGDGAFTSADGDAGMVQFKFNSDGSPAKDIATELKLASYMGLRQSGMCPSSTANGTLVDRIGETPQAVIQTLTKVSSSATTFSALSADDRDRVCVRLVMLWAQGYDLLDADKDSVRNELRPDILGDVFHSSPINVDPPVETFLCDLGLSTQCARTIYSTSLGGNVKATPQGPTTSGVKPIGFSSCAPRTLAPYEAWQAQYSSRQRVILVGANDGMVHAFDNGTAQTTGSSCPGGVLLPKYNNGTGKEIWAFIPPDQLPRLASQIFSHQYMVDGDIMVRDIWNDDNDNGKKEAGEFHTLAVVSEGRGGNHYVALELQFDSSTGNLTAAPGFRWMFPQPCSEESSTFGKTLLSLSPKAPPIGPMWFKENTNSSVKLIKDAAADNVERWVVALSGGWSPGLERGRGIYIVDAWRGQVGGRRDNLWWKFEYDNTASVSTPAHWARFSVPAPVALVDYGPDNLPAQDSFFDTAVWGDTGGQVWVARMQDPAVFDQSGTHLVTNWSAARSLEMDRDGIATATTSYDADGGVEATDDPADPKSFLNKQPFYYLPSVAMQPGSNRMRVFVGSGNRYALLEKKAGMCRFDNMAACSKYGCTEPKVEYHYKDKITEIKKMETHWKAGVFEHANLDENVTIKDYQALSQSNACDDATAKMATYHTGTCGSVPNEDINLSSYTCTQTTSNVAYACTATSEKRDLGDLLSYDDVSTTGLGKNRFIGFWAYGGSLPDGGLRTFGGDAGTASNFDNNRLSDRTSANTVAGDLVDVSNVSCTVAGCDGGAAETGLGWVLDYDGIEQKTATGGAIIASCVLWNDLAPSGGDGGVCGAAVVPASRLYQADFLTGTPNCAAGFLPADGGAYVRSIQRSVVAPPPEPASVVQVSKTGQIKYSAMIVEPGQNQATTADVSVGQDILQVVYELPITRAMHNCRHTQDGNCVVAP